MRPKPTLAALCAAVLFVCPGRAQAAVVNVAAGSNLQAAINAAQPGDTLLLAAGATFTGNFVLPAKTGTAWITIRSSAPDSALPPSGGRMSPAMTALLARIQSPNSGAALATAPYAHNYRLEFLEFAANYQGYGDIIQLGDGSSAQNSLAMIPHDLVLDRVYIHGDPSFGQKRGISLNSAATTITGSYISDIKGIGQDSQAIGGWNGPGPYTISNNYLEAAGENILFGGADPSISNLVPSDISISGNYVSKPTAWRTQVWQVKNLLELKNAQRVTIDSNLFENNWQAAQPGYSILFTPRNQDGTAPWSVVQQVQFTNNIVRHVAGGFNILGTDNLNPSLQTNNLTIRNNLLIDVSSAEWGGSGWVVQIDGGSTITIDHNTMLTDAWSALYADGTPTSGFTFTNNIIPDNGYGIMGAGQSPGNGTIRALFPGGVFLDNVIVGAPSWQFPASNYYPASLADVGFAFAGGGDYSLSPSSPYRHAATDNSVVGCNFVTLAHALEVTVAGPGGTPDFNDPPPNPSVAGWSNGSRNNDVVWQTGPNTIAIWTLNALSLVSSTSVDLGGLDPSWKVVGAADIDGDGRNDLVWQNAVSGTIGIWFRTASGLGSAVVLDTGGVDISAWKVVGIADFNGDGHPDILLRNEPTGQLGLWCLNVTQTVSMALVAPGATPDPSWRVAGVADFNGDGRPDILFRNANTGQLGTMLMQGTTPIGVAMLSPDTVADPDWQVAAITDLDGDGHPDIVWQHASGAIRVWIMNGVALQSPLDAAAPGSGWRIRAAR